MALEHNCGVVLAYDLTGREGNVVGTTVDLLEHLRHRGHDMCGVAAAQNNTLTTHHGLGTPAEALGNARSFLQGSAAIGHTRYTTNKTKDIKGAHPRDYPNSDPAKHIAYAFNGQIMPTEEALRLLEGLGHAVDLNDDTGILGALLAHNVRTRESLREALGETWSQVSGAHNGVALRRNGEAFAWSDPMKFHPLSWAKRGNMFVVLSETNPLDEVWDGREERGEIKPGEMVRIRPGEDPEFIQVQKPEERAFCPFEPYYFMKGGSQIGETSANRIRIRSGATLARIDDAEGFLKQYPDLLVVPVPETGKYFAEGYANRSKRARADAITRQENFDKRTFILSGDGLRQKFKFDPQMIRGRDIVLMDDSIVKGNTMPFILQILREECAPKSIHVRSGFPIVRSPCFYGINMPTIQDLWWSKYMVMLHEGKNLDDVHAAMLKEFGVDSLKFMPADQLSHTIRGFEKDMLCRGCTEGIYPTTEGQKLYDAQLHQILTYKP